MADRLLRAMQAGCVTGGSPIVHDVAAALREAAELRELVDDWLEWSIRAKPVLERAILGGERHE